MLLVPVPVILVQPRLTRRSNDQEILGILFFSFLRKIERTTDHGRFVNDDDLVVGDCVRCVYEGRNAGICHE